MASRGIEGASGGIEGASWGTTQGGIKAVLSHRTSLTKVETVERHPAPPSERAPRSILELSVAPTKSACSSAAQRTEMAVATTLQSSVYLQRAHRGAFSAVQGGWSRARGRGGVRTTAASGSSCCAWRRCNGCSRRKAP